ncbi:MAG: hypothetical protein HWD59_12550 [Coxiellaceae bacterium]|nr:MAG: hypothetical protein HWD59_12550 [Coxiellaceae bacterium]
MLATGKLSLDIKVKLRPVLSDADIKALPEDIEPLEVVADVPMVLAEIVTDEILLGLPTAAKHDNEQCHAAAEKQAEEKTETKPNPFCRVAFGKI